MLDGATTKVNPAALPPDLEGPLLLEGVCRPLGNSTGAAAHQLPTVDESFELYEVKELTVEDLAELEMLDSSSQTSATVAFASMKPAHHEIARLIALGMKNTVVAERVGMTTQTVINVKQNPAFRALVMHYQRQREVQASDLTVDIAATARRLVTTVQSRLDEHEGANGDPGDPNRLDDRTLKDLTLGMLDRAGHAPVQRVDSRNLNVTLTQDEMAAMKAEIAEREASLTGRSIPQQPSGEPSGK